MDFVTFLLVIGIILFFILGRELICWYLKITENVNELKKNNKNLEKIIETQKEIIKEMKNSK
ncbi:MAG: hypothetical protein FXF47_03545 [Candidatus Mcinerneyibacterium aminivorans]|uniref:Uncharacterized protein n=1 Tax=Candidatus Mcinerneyibacterium aminivorans TaxID=2703815 RepID=A0A5D0MJ97_9BACT|nr:MAG: hypothetical protein FXF47_03545 [Candidatus Mcinerneyibacterium aminivorans]